MSKYRILSIDGGGIRGVITAILIKRIQGEPGLGGFLDDIDLIAGTSTGGLLALGIANGLDPTAIREVYEEKGPIIFKDTLLDDLMDLGKLVGADYDLKGLKDELQILFGDRTLGDLEKKVLITTFDLDNKDVDEEKRTWKPKLFHNCPGDGDDREVRAVDVGLYTSAAPTYFPSANGFIDGGVFATNPSMCGLAQSQDSRYKPNPDLNDVVLFSLGTGTCLRHIEGDRHDWGYVQWAKPLIGLMLDGTTGIADYQCNQILGDRYRRLAPVFPSGVKIPLDGVKNIPYMVEYAEQVDIEDAVQWLKDHWVAD